MKAEEVFQAYNDYIVPTYTRQPVIFVKAKGIKIWDIHGRAYLDFFPGWGVSNLGHCHPSVLAAIRDQVGKLIHVPNNYYSLPQAKAAKEINFWAKDTKVFFCNSGAEANEAAIKFARAFGKGRFEIITFKNSFHGRTLGALAATGQEKYKQGFSPLPQGFLSVDFNSIEAVKKKLKPETVAIMLELIQGEGGINVADIDFIIGLRQLCDRNNLLLIFDEVQTAMGRTGEMFAYEHYDVKPDVMTLAKALAGGLPIGAMVVKKSIADTLGPGMHASTFGGSPLVAKAILAVFKAIQKEKLLKNARDMGEYMFARLEKLKQKYPMIKDVRGLGLMIGIELDIPGKPIVEECFRRGLLINCTHESVIRLMPPLNVTKKQTDKALSIFENALKLKKQGDEKNS